MLSQKPLDGLFVCRQDAQASSELARIAEVFTDQHQPTEEPCGSSSSSKGADLLALMDTC